MYICKFLGAETQLELRELIWNLWDFHVCHICCLVHPLAFNIYTSTLFSFLRLFHSTTCSMMSTCTFFSFSYGFYIYFAWTRILMWLYDNQSMLSICSHGFWIMQCNYAIISFENLYSAQLKANQSCDIFLSFFKCLNTLLSEKLLTKFWYLLYTVWIYAVPIDLHCWCTAVSSFLVKAVDCSIASIDVSVRLYEHPLSFGLKWTCTNKSLHLIDLDVTGPLPISGICYTHNA